MLATPALAHRAPAAAPPVAQVQEGQFGHPAPSGGYPYLLHIPAGYNADASAHWPVIVFLHGKGERGSDLNPVRVHGPPKLVGSDPAFPFILLSPQVPVSEEGWDPAKLDATLDAALEGLRADRRRIYLTGLSMGGIGTWAWAIARPHLFAAIAPVAARGDPSAVCATSAIPTWAFHGDNDPIVSTQGGIAMVEAQRACGGDPRLTIYPDTGHASWEAAYADAALYLWFLHQRSRSTGR
ncbi:MAG: dienelactone hydrolase family protein [Erythrobacter sp.]